MLRATLAFGFLLATPGSAMLPARAQSPSTTVASHPIVPGVPRTIDGIAARIEDDIITESEVDELAAFQQLVDGRSKSREEIIRELADQWLVRQEAMATNYTQPPQDEVDHAYGQFVKQFHSPAEFQSRIAAVGLSEAAVRRLIQQQLYLSRFLDYRFRPAAQVDQTQIESYYENEFAPELRKRGEQVPPLDDVEDTIREVLVQRAINERATKWLDDTRERLKIDIVPQGAGS
jgi:Ribbon-helix-helix protein, copG family